MTKIFEEQLHINMTQKIYNDGIDMYTCTAAIGSDLSSAVWQIKKTTVDSDITIVWADGDCLYDNLATDLSTVKDHNYS